MSPPNVRAFRRALSRWYRNYGRDLPWRRSRDSYAVVVSEFMLQQTQVKAVIPYYHRWLRRFPSVATLAAASESEVLHAWQGLGYYSRARNLHASAKIVMKKHHGIFPRSAEQLRELPGFGLYTANAVLTFASDLPVPIVEANIARVIARLLDLKIAIDCPAGRGAIWDFARDLVPSRDAAIFNSALMDLGALVCLPHQPRCTICPVKKFCHATNPANLPLKKARPGVKELTEDHGFALHKGRILLEQSQKRWRGMWILPRIKRRPRFGPPLHTSRFPFTNHRVTLAVYGQKPTSRLLNATQRWFPLEAIDSIPLPSPHRRAVSELIAKHRQKLCSGFSAT